MPRTRCTRANGRRAGIDTRSGNSVPASLKFESVPCEVKVHALDERVGPCPPGSAILPLTDVTAIRLFAQLRSSVETHGKPRQQSGRSPDDLPKKRGDYPYYGGGVPFFQVGDSFPQRLVPRVVSAQENPHFLASRTPVVISLGAGPLRQEVWLTPAASRLLPCT